MSDIIIILAPTILQKENETNVSNKEYVILSDTLRQKAKRSNFLSINFLITTLSTEIEVLKESLISEIVHRIKSLQESSKSNFVILIPLTPNQWEYFEKKNHLEEFEKKIADEISFLTRIERPCIELKLFHSEVEFCKNISTEKHFCFDIDFKENVTDPFPLENITDSINRPDVVAALLR